MRKKAMMMIMIGAACLTVACGQKKTGSDATAVVTTTVSDATTKAETTTEVTETTGKASPQEKGEISMVTGTLISISDDSTEFVMEAKGGGEKKVSLLNADLETTGSLEKGYQVTVIGSDPADAATLSPILVVDANEKLKLESVTGTVESQAMSSFTIATEDGKSMSFLKINYLGADENALGEPTGDGNGSGDKVKVTYVTVPFESAGDMMFPVKVESAK